MENQDGLEKKYVAVFFEGSNQTYDFFTTMDLVRGEEVIVATVRGYALVRVHQMLKHSDKANNWVIQKVDLEQEKMLKGHFKSNRQKKRESTVEGWRE
jgi:hypothetical protein